MGDHIQTVEGEHPTIDVWITTKSFIVQVLITNSVLPRHPVMSELVRIRLRNIEEVKKAYIERIDDTHAKPTWIQMGGPESLRPDQVKTLETASELIKEPFLFSFANNAVSLEIEVPPQGTALVTLETI